MSVALRVKSLLERHGDSFRKAAKKTGVSYETIRRIVGGYNGPTLSYHVTRIAHGYGVGEKSLLEGLDPRGDFEWTIHQAPPVQRLEFLMMSLQERVRLTLDFLSNRYASSVTRDLLATASGVQSAELEAVLSRWETSVPDLRTAADIARGISRLTGISPSWFEHGWVDGEEAGRAIELRFCRLCSSATKSKKHTPQRTQRLLQKVRGHLT